MTEPIEQLVARLANDADGYFSESGAEMVWAFSEADLIEFAKACMLHQARRDVEILRGINNYDNPMTANDAADAIEKSVEGLRG